MKASELNKKSILIDTLYEHIKMDNEDNRHKHVTPFGVYISEEVKNELMRNGFKLTFDSMGSLIIEW